LGRILTTLDVETTLQALHINGLKARKNAANREILHRFPDRESSGRGYQSVCSGGSTQRDQEGSHAMFEQPAFFQAARKTSIKKDEGQRRKAFFPNPVETLQDRVPRLNVHQGKNIDGLMQEHPSSDGPIRGGKDLVPLQLHTALQVQNLVHVLAVDEESERIRTCLGGNIHVKDMIANQMTELWSTRVALFLFPVLTQPSEDGRGSLAETKPKLVE